MSRHPVQTADAGDWSTAQTLAGATHWLLAHRGATVVVKYGGHAMGNIDLGRAFARDIAARVSSLRLPRVHGIGLPRRASPWRLTAASVAGEIVLPLSAARILAVCSGDFGTPLPWSRKSTAVPIHNGNLNLRVGVQSGSPALPDGRNAGNAAKPSFVPSAP